MAPMLTFKDFDGQFAFNTLRRVSAHTSSKMSAGPTATSALVGEGSRASSCEATDSHEQFLHVLSLCYSHEPVGTR